MLMSVSDDVTSVIGIHKRNIHMGIKQINQSDYSGIEFTVNVKQYNKIEKQHVIIINVFSYENKQPYPIYVLKEKFENQMNLLLITEDENKHCISIKDFNRFMFNQTNHKEKDIFVCSVYKFSAKKVFSRNTKLSVMSSMVDKLSECLIKEG